MSGYDGMSLEEVKGRYPSFFGWLKTMDKKDTEILSACATELSYLSMAESVQKQFSRNIGNMGDTTQLKIGILQSEIIRYHANFRGW